jgi:23S rRNA pseudouridine1911/1915/1917 synthase
MRDFMNASQAGLEVLYEDDVLLAVNKPAGLVVHPTYKNPAGTLLDMLRGGERGGDPSIRFFLAGRLDRLTSGVVVAVKSQDAYVAIQRAWSEATKDYLAVVCGRVEPVCGDIDLRLGPDPYDRRRRVVSETSGAPSLTRFERLAFADLPPAGLSLLRCRLVTGRRHQIRVHLAARGWPIVGDSLYGRPAPPLFPRQALHAWRVAFTHPITRARLTIEAPVPADLEALLAASGLSALFRAAVERAR